jgi:hypothetical protein
MGNIFRVYKDSEVTTDRIRAENAADRIVTPARVVNVFTTTDTMSDITFTSISAVID